MNILHIDSCALGDSSASRQYTAAIVSQLTIADPQANLLYRDLAAAPLSHASGPLLQVLSERWDASIPMSTELSAEALQSASLLQEFHDADLVVIGAPMHNYSVPSTLKAWLDRLLELTALKACKEDNANKRVILVTSSCTFVGNTPMESLMDHHETLLKAAFTSLGVTRQHVLRNNTDLSQPLEFKAAA
ncbi:FMN-dependent NADH-azoreductase [Duganella aceris]|uniref:FMN-dependent NADH-azoreductase n=1 Tax=Duganella aceris TaxID=2703883 RepID=A0ABX0FLQ4_9BURK|nr:NAD(P)H-dependent oxidoreductase [Duganella aceris]NGZ85442.1 FMN-dependent NADH-azoreductase [Duganella aceris]